ncbi:hypothetical protein BURK1_00186 [Burkholderiales bacterium]|nr:hypothetical protein BURK1_00186 [Burkholderiales bacterium]
MRTAASLALAAALACAAGVPVEAHAAAPARCDASWRIVPRLDASPRALDVDLAFDADTRTSTELALTREWGGVRDFADAFGAWRVAAAHQRVEPAPDALTVRVVHRPGERVSVRYRVTSSVDDPGQAPLPDPRDSYRVLLGRDAFQFFGYAVLAVPATLDALPRARLCLSIEGAPPGTIVTSHGTAGGTSWQTTVVGSPDRLRHAAYLGGRIDVAERAMRGGRLVVARRGRWNFPLSALADATARVVAAHRAFWNDEAFPYLLVTLVPNGHPSGSYGGTAVHQAFAMNAADDFTVPGSAFDFLVGHEHLHTWIPGRMGAMGGEAGEAEYYWYSEGLTDHYTHRLLLRAGLWTLDDYAAALNAKIARYLASPERNTPNARVRDAFFESPALGDLPYQRGEFLALRWDAMLREAGTDLDAVVRTLLVTRDEADRLERLGPDAPADRYAHRRLIVALSTHLGGRVDEDVERYVEQGQTIAFTPGLLGPCFAMSMATRPMWTLGFDPRSLAARTALGVDPTGPAYAAGLRDGDRIDGYGIERDEVTKPVRLDIRGADGAGRTLRYLPVGSGSIEVPVYRVDATARATQACTRWIGEPAPPPRRGVRS